MSDREPADITPCFAPKTTSESSSSSYPSSDLPVNRLPIAADGVTQALLDENPFFHSLPRTVSRAASLEDTHTSHTSATPFPNPLSARGSFTVVHAEKERPEKYKTDIAQTETASPGIAEMVNLSSESDPMSFGGTVRGSPTQREQASRCGRMPNLGDCGHFDGEAPASRWLSRVKWEFRRVGITEDSPSVIIEAINMQCEGDAAVFMDSSPEARAIVNRAVAKSSLPGDLAALEQMLNERYPAKVLDELAAVQPAEELGKWMQGENESLAAYYSRTQSLLRRMGARDAPRSRADKPLSSLEMFTLKAVVAAFVGGLCNADLETEAIDKNAGGKASLLECLETVRGAQQILEAKLQLQRGQLEALRMQMMEKVIAASTGLPVDQALERSFPTLKFPVLDAARSDRRGERRSDLPLSAELTTSSAASISRMSHLFETGMELEPKPFWKAHREAALPSRDGQALQTAEMTGALGGGQNASQGYRAKGGASTGVRFAPSTANGRFPMPDPASLPPRESSRNMLINGKEKILNSTRACFRCGRRDHFKTNCTTPEADCLKPWEQAWLRLLLTKPASGGAPTPVSANLTPVAASARLCGVEEDLMSAVHPDRVPMISGPSDVTFGSECCEVSVEDEVAESSAAQACAAESFSAEAESQSNVLYLAALLADAVHAGKKRRLDGGAVPLADMLNDPDQPKPRVSRTRRAKRLPREIYGRQGEGPFDWKQLANQVEVKLSLMDLFQISPEGSTALKQMATRISDKTCIKARKMADKRRTTPMNVDMDACGATLGCDLARAYRITPSIRYKVGSESHTKAMPANSAHTDQGSDINIISWGAVEAFGLKRRRLSDLGISKMFVKTSTGESSRVTEFVVVEVGVMSVWRVIWAIVRPKPQSGEGSDPICLILGLPWLWDVDAYIDVRSHTLWIGDKREGEPRVQLKGPSSTLGGGGAHRLCLTPDGPPIRLDPARVVEEVDDSDESSSDDDSVSDDSGDEEDDCADASVCSDNQTDSKN